MLELWLEKISPVKQEHFFSAWGSDIQCHLRLPVCQEMLHVFKLVLHAMTWRITITIRNETELDSLKILISKRQYYTDKYVGSGHVVHL